MSETNEPELLPCPFCGGEAYAALFPEMEHDVWIACLECESMSKTEEAWNRRTPAAPQWTTEPPQEEGWYRVLYSRKHVDCVEIIQGSYGYDTVGLGIEVDTGSEWIDRMQFYSLEEYIEKYDVRGWCKVDFPPLPEEKE